MADISVPIGLELEAIVNGEAIGVAFELYNGLTRVTPVGDPSLWKDPAPAGYVGGRARSNWFMSSGAANRTTTEDTQPTKSAQVANNAIAAANAVIYPTIIISNNLPYILPLNDGHSSQAPKKFVEMEINRVTNASKV